MDDEEAELRNPFPSPPSHYSRYTTHNLHLLALLNERSLGNESTSQQELLSDQIDVPDWQLRSLEKPRVDWILDEPEAQYQVFGDTWFVKDRIPSLAELGGNQLYPADPSTDRRPALLSILKSLLVTYSYLTSSLLAPPPTSSSAGIPPEWHRHTEWITVLSQNILAAANDLRPVQARGNLELMMKRQLEIRKQETVALHSKCDTLELKLAELCTNAQLVATQTATFASIGPVSATQSTPNPTIPSTAVSKEDVLRWAEQI